MAKLKPCPFCGGDVAIVRGENCWFITRGIRGAKGCNCRLFMESDAFHKDDVVARREAKENLIKAWNTRNPWRTGQPTEDGLYRVLWLDTDEEIKRYSDLFWNSGNDTWYDEVTPDCNWGDEYHAKVLEWMPIEPSKVVRTALKFGDTMEYEGHKLVLKKGPADPCLGCKRDIDCFDCEEKCGCEVCFFADEPSCPDCGSEGIAGIWVEVDNGTDH